MTSLMREFGTAMTSRWVFDGLMLLLFVLVDVFEFVRSISVLADHVLDNVSNDVADDDDGHDVVITHERYIRENHHYDPINVFRMKN